MTFLISQELKMSKFWQRVNHDFGLRLQKNPFIFAVWAIWSKSWRVFLVSDSFPRLTMHQAWQSDPLTREESRWTQLACFCSVSVAKGVYQETSINEVNWGGGKIMFLQATHSVFRYQNISGSTQGRSWKLQWLVSLFHFWFSVPSGIPAARPPVLHSSIAHPDCGLKYSTGFQSDQNLFQGGAHFPRLWTPWSPRFRCSDWTCCRNWQRSTSRS